jgi:hypothetical protein
MPLADSPFTWLDALANGLVYPVIFAIVTLLTGATFAYVWRRLAYIRRLLPIRRWEITVWPPGVSTGDVTVAYALIPPEKIHLPYYMVEEGDVRCLYLMCTLLGDLFGREHVRAEDEASLRSGAHTRPNLVIVSGPVWNKTMELYLGLTGSPVSFMWDGDDLKLRDQAGTEYRTTYVGNHRVKRCHGMIVAAQIAVAGQEQRVVIVAGCSNLSTYAGAELLLRVSQDRSLRRQLRESKIARGGRWCLVYRVENWGEQPDEDDNIPTMQSGTLRLDLVAPYAAPSFVEPFEFRLGARVTR